MPDFKYRPRAAIWTGVLIIVIDALVATLDYLENGIFSFLGSLPFYLAVTWAVTVFLFKPSIKISHGMVQIVNPFRSISFPMAAIAALDTRRGLVIKTKQESFRVAAAVPPGRYTVARANKADFRWLASSSGGSPDSLSPGDILESDSGAVAFVIRKELRSIRDSNPSVLEAQPSKRFDYVSLVLGLALGIGTTIQALS